MFSAEKYLVNLLYTPKVLNQPGQERPVDESLGLQCHCYPIICYHGPGRYLANMNNFLHYSITEESFFFRVFQK